VVQDKTQRQTLVLVAVEQEVVPMAVLILAETVALEL
jgi:hypothetical protein